MVPKSNGSIIETEETTQREVGEVEEMSGRGERMEGALASLTEAMALLAQVQAKATESRQTDNKARWIQAIAAVATCIVLVVTIVRWTSITEAELRQQIALQQQNIQQATKDADRSLAAVDKLETYNHNTRVQFALHGWSIDPQTGVITNTKIRKER